MQIKALSRAFWDTSSLSPEAERSALSNYWYLYGGARALLRSRYVWISGALTVVTAKSWVTEDGRNSLSQAALDIVPGLLGFSIGAMAILLAFSQSKFFTALSEKGSARSAFLDLSSKFVHFIIVQAAAIIAAFMLKIYGGWTLALATCFLLIYAVMTAVATGLTLFGMAEIHNKILGRSDCDTED